MIEHMSCGSVMSLRMSLFIQQDDEAAVFDRSVREGRARKR